MAIKYVAQHCDIASSMHDFMPSNNNIHNSQCKLQGHQNRHKVIKVQNAGCVYSYIDNCYNKQDYTLVGVI